MAKLPEVQRHKRFKRDPADYVETTENESGRRRRRDVSRRRPPPRNNDFDQLLEELKTTKRQLSEAEKGFRSDLYGCLSNAYAMAEKMHEQRQLWLEFIKDPFSARCRRKKPSPTDQHGDIVFWVLRYLFDVTCTTGSRYNRVYKYASTLRRFAKEEVSADDVEEKLREKGTEYAFAGDDPDEGEEDRDSEDDLETSEEGKPKGPARRASQRAVAADSSRSRGGPRRATAKPKPVLYVEVSESQMAEVLANPCGIIEYEHGAGSVPNGEPGWQRVVATRVLSSDD